MLLLSSCPSPALAGRCAPAQAGAGEGSSITPSPNFCVFVYFAGGVSNG